MDGDLPETWLLVEPMQDRLEVVGELRGDCIKLPRAIQGQEENVFLGEGDVELMRMRRYP